MIQKKNTRSLHNFRRARMLDTINEVTDKSTAELIADYKESCKDLSFPSLDDLKDMSILNEKYSHILKASRIAKQLINHVYTDMVSSKNAIETSDLNFIFFISQKANQFVIDFAVAKVRDKNLDLMIKSDFCKLSTMFDIAYSISNESKKLIRDTLYDSFLNAYKASSLNSEFIQSISK
jgi:hypothetical protein